MYILYIYNYTYDHQARGLKFECHAWQMQDCTIKVLLPGSRLSKGWKNFRVSDCDGTLGSLACISYQLESLGWSSYLAGGVPPSKSIDDQRPPTTLRWVQHVADLDLHSGENVSVPTGRRLKKGLEIWLDWMEDVKRWQWHCYTGLYIDSRFASSSWTFSEDARRAASMVSKSWLWLSMPGP